MPGAHAPPATQSVRRIVVKRQIDCVSSSLAAYPRGFSAIPIKEMSHNGLRFLATGDQFRSDV
jgi:hypothetical protein